MGFALRACRLPAEAEIIACALLVADVQAVSIRRAACTMLTCERDSLQEEEGHPNSQRSLNSHRPSFSSEVRLLKSQSNNLEEKA